jgi:hypothetical protein
MLGPNPPADWPKIVSIDQKAETGLYFVAFRVDGLKDTNARLCARFDGHDPIFQSRDASGGQADDPRCP